MKTSFSLPDQNGKVHNLTDYAGKKVLLYFYPKDDTPGCTTEACNFSNIYAKLKKLGVVVLGISADSQKSHAKFADKFSLPFPLLSDPDKIVIKQFGVWKAKSFMGRKYLGISRESFLLDEKGKLIKHYKTIKTAEHADEVLKDILK